MSSQVKRYMSEHEDSIISALTISQLIQRQGADAVQFSDDMKTVTVYWTPDEPEVFTLI